MVLGRFIIGGLGYTGYVFDPPSFNPYEIRQMVGWNSFHNMGPWSRFEPLCKADPDRD